MIEAIFEQVISYIGEAIKKNKHTSKSDRYKHIMWQLEDMLDEIREKGELDTEDE